MKETLLAKRLRALFSWNNWIVHPDPPGRPNMGKVEDTKELHITGIVIGEILGHREYWERTIVELESRKRKK